LKPQLRRISNRLRVFARTTPAIRTVTVLPPSQSDEGAWVFLTSGLISLAALYVFAFQLYHTPGSVEDRTSGAFSFQVMFRDLPSQEQREFRLMQEGFGEAKRRRAASGQWPEVEPLANAEIPPFAQDIVDKSALAWSRRQQGPIINYIGVPTNGTETPAFLILIQEPPPTGGEDPSLTMGVDEEHQLLPDGKLLHVTYWKRSLSTPPSSGPIIDPAMEGWFQIRVGSPFAIAGTQ